MTHRAELLAGLGVGIGLAYLFDPARGGRRRALVRDTAVSGVHTVVDAADATTRDVTNRLVGTVAELLGHLERDSASDETIVERVRAKLGRVVSHPHAIHVTSDDHVITLSGAILAVEVPRLLRTVEGVRGVREVINQLEEHQQAENIPSLQGGTTPPGLQPDIWQRQWAPATRVAVGAAGVGMAVAGAQRRDVPGWLFMIGGLGLVARAATNLETKRLVGIGAGRRAVDLQETITIDAPAEDVPQVQSEK